MSLEVHRVIPVELDLGNLSVFDINAVDVNTLKYRLSTLC